MAKREGGFLIAIYVLGLFGCLGNRKGLAHVSMVVDCGLVRNLIAHYNNEPKTNVQDETRFVNVWNEAEVQGIHLTVDSSRFNPTDLLSRRIPNGWMKLSIGSSEGGACYVLVGGWVIERKVILYRWNGSRSLTYHLTEIDSSLLTNGDLVTWLESTCCE